MSAKKPGKTQIAKNLIKYYAYLLIVWGFYRLLLFQFPPYLEIPFIKPVIWLTPLYFIVKKENLKLKDLGITSHKLYASIYLAIFLGLIFAFEGLLINYLKYGHRFQFQSNIGEGIFIVTLFLSFITAITEELSFRGYIFTRLLKFTRNEWIANLVTSTAWTLIHIPIAALDWRLAFPNLLLYLCLVFTFSVGASYIFARTKNIASSVFLHVLWQWPIILYR